jgi:hypothetical protein
VINQAVLASHGWAKMDSRLRGNDGAPRFMKQSPDHSITQ